MHCRLRHAKAAVNRKDTGTLQVPQFEWHGCRHASQSHQTQRITKLPRLHVSTGNPQQGKRGTAGIQQTHKVLLASSRHITHSPVSYIGTPCCWDGIPNRVLSFNSCCCCAAQ